MTRAEMRRQLKEIAERDGANVIRFSCTKDNMVIIKNEHAHRLKPEFIRRVVAEGWVRTRNGYVYKRHEYGNTGNYFITRKEPLTDEEKIICHIEVRK